MSKYILTARDRNDAKPEIVSSYDDIESAVRAMESHVNHDIDGNQYATSNVTGILEITVAFGQGVYAIYRVETHE